MVWCKRVRGEEDKVNMLKTGIFGNLAHANRLHEWKIRKSWKIEWCQSINSINQSIALSQKVENRKNRMLWEIGSIDWHSPAIDWHLENLEKLLSWNVLFYPTVFAITLVI